MLEVLQLIQQTGDFDLDGEKIQALLKEIRQLQKHHAMFRVRRFTRNDEAGRITGALLRILTPQFLMGFVHERLVDVFGDEEPDLSPEHIQMIVSHIYSQVILNILLPRKEISNPLEKLYWLILPSGHLEHEPLTPEQSASVRGLWNLLKKVVTEKDAK